MQKKLDGPSQLGQVREVRKGLKKRTRVAYSALCLLAIVVMFAGCGGGGSEGVSSQTVNGVAAVGTALDGWVAIKDASTPAREKATLTGSDGSFNIDVADMKAPFILQAVGSADGEDYILHSFADGPGTANINPLSDAAVASAAEVDDPGEIYEKADEAKLDKIRNNIRGSIARLLAKLRPLLKRYNAQSDDPIKVRFKTDHRHLDGLFDDVRIAIANGILTITNKKTGLVIYTGNIQDIINGYFEDDDSLPNPTTTPPPDTTPPVTPPPDTTPPAVQVPADMTVAAAIGSSGAVVTFSATATDNVDGAITPSCTTLSGSTFAVGTTAVTCSATDAASNTGSATFSVTVTPPAVTAVSFKDAIQPIIASCTGCHGSAGGVSLTTYAGVSAAVVSGSAATSKLYIAITTGGKMVGYAASFSAAQIQAIADWINQGAQNN